MSRDAFRRIDASVHPVLLKTRRSNGSDQWDVIGTAFCVNQKYNPTFITNAHVVDDGKGDYLKNDSLALMVMAHDGGPAGLSVMIFEKDLDIAVCEASKEASVATPAVFGGTDLLEIGTSLASTGFPIPHKPELTKTGGSLQITKRLATGYLSNSGVTARVRDWPWTDKLRNYELNMLSYPGISGGPLFDLKGLVDGVNRGTRLYEEQIAAYAIAVRNAELLPFLDRSQVEYTVG